MSNGTAVIARTSTRTGPAAAILALVKGFGMTSSEILDTLRQVGESVAINTEADPEKAAFARVRLRSLGAEEELLQEEGGVLSDASFARAARVNARQTVHNWAAQGKVFTVPRGPRNHGYPAWQIHHGALLPGLAEVLAVLHGAGASPYETLIFFLTPAQALDDKRPLDLLRQGAIGPVVTQAKHYGDIRS